MGSATHTKSLARRVGPALLGCALSVGVFAYSLWSGSAPVPEKYRADDVSRWSHPVWFWLVEIFWLLAAVAAAAYGQQEYKNARLGLPRPAPKARHDGLPESLSEMVRTHRVPRESVPRLLAELRPSLKPSDYYPILHQRAFEWLGTVCAFIFLAGMIATLALLPQVSRIFTISLFGLAIVVFVAVSFGIPAALRKRRHTQMERIFAAEALHEQTHRPAPPIAPRVRKTEPIDTEGRELRCTSPDRRYVIYVRPEEMKMSQWVFTPEMIDSTTNRVVFHPRDSGWTLDKAVWQTASLVAMTLRKYPGDHAPIGATFDCASGAAQIEGITVDPFTNSAMMEHALKEAYAASKSAYHPVEG
ncbi:MAG: hypothetical protein WBX18_08770 [Terracidiphilus sp.]